MAIVPPDTWVIAEMITHDYIWRGAGLTCEEAKQALLSAWTTHRRWVLSQHPQLAATLPEAAGMPQHFAIRYSEFTRGGGYRDGERLA